MTKTHKQTYTRRGLANTNYINTTAYLFGTVCGNVIWVNGSSKQTFTLWNFELIIVFIDLFNLVSSQHFQ